VVERFVALACEVDELVIWRLTVERDETRIADEAGMAKEVMIDCFAQEVVSR
jgi:hypothetical protein